MDRGVVLKRIFQRGDVEGTSQATEDVDLSGEGFRVGEALGLGDVGGEALLIGLLVLEGKRRSEKKGSSFVVVRSSEGNETSLLFSLTHQNLVSSAAARVLRSFSVSTTPTTRSRSSLGIHAENTSEKISLCGLRNRKEALKKLAPVSSSLLADDARCVKVSTPLVSLSYLWDRLDGHRLARALARGQADDPRAPGAQNLVGDVVSRVEVAGEVEVESTGDNIARARFVCLRRRRCRWCCLARERDGVADRGPTRRRRRRRGDVTDIDVSRGGGQRSSRGLVLGVRDDRRRRQAGQRTSGGTSTSRRRIGTIVIGRGQRRWRFGLGTAASTAEETRGRRL